MTALERIDALIAETERWRDNYRREGFGIDALACVIRIGALKEARKIIAKAGT